MLYSKLVAITRKGYKMVTKTNIANNEVKESKDCSLKEIKNFNKMLAYKVPIAYKEILLGKMH